VEKKGRGIGRSWYYMTVRFEIIFGMFLVFFLLSHPTPNTLSPLPPTPTACSSVKGFEVIGAEFLAHCRRKKVCILLLII
jgi:hypothetical protein